jgi:hypothetical protein
MCFTFDSQPTYSLYDEKKASRKHKLLNILNFKRRTMRKAAWKLRIVGGLWILAKGGLGRKARRTQEMPRLDRSGRLDTAFHGCVCLCHLKPPFSFFVASQYITIVYYKPAWDIFPKTRLFLAPWTTNRNKCQPHPPSCSLKSQHL